MMKPRKGKDNVKSRWLRLYLQQPAYPKGRGVTDDLITGYMAFGVKLARRMHRLF